jgi:cytochrome c5/Ca2+-binding EF-hand superfamily protein
MKFKLQLFIQLFLTVMVFHESLANPLANPAIKSPEIASTYRQSCSHCHSGSAPSAPRIGDTAAWSERLSGGFNQLYHSAINGVANTAMLAKGGHTELIDDQIKALVGYMLLQSKVSSKTISQAIQYDSYNISDREFILLDSNKNAQLEKNELQKELSFLNVFTEFDANSDGKLSPAEFTALRSSLETKRQSSNIPDGEITNQVNEALSKLKGMPPSGIRVNTKNGALTIAGVVGSNELIAQIQQSIRWIPGIKTFDNRLMTSEMLAFD